MAKKKAIKKAKAVSEPKNDLAEYIKGKWHGFDNYNCPYHPKYFTITQSDFRKHMRKHEKPVKRKELPAPKAKPNTSKENKGGSK